MCAESWGVKPNHAADEMQLCLTLCSVYTLPVEGEVRRRAFLPDAVLERGCGYKRWLGQKIGSVGACNPRSPETQRILKKEKMKTALMAGLVAGVVLGDGHGGGGGSHQSQYGGGGGGGGGQTAYSSYASGAQDAFNQLGETIPGTPGEDYPILAEVRIIQLLLLTLPLLPK